MPDLRSVRSMIPSGEAEALPSREPFVSRHCGPGVPPTAEAALPSMLACIREHRGRALITLAAGRRTVPSMYFSRPDAASAPPTPPPRVGGDAPGGVRRARTATSASHAPLRSAAREEERGAGRGGRVDAQADMPLDEPRAQVAFKDSMIRGILQFTLRIAFRCVLHRCKSQDIRC